MKKVKLEEVVKDLTEERKIIISDWGKIMEPTITSKTHSISPRRFCLGSELKIKKRVLIKKEDLVFSKLHTQNGSFAFADQEYQSTTTFLPLKILEDKILKDFLFNQLHLVVPKLQASDTVGRETYKTKDILNIEIDLPSILKQKQILKKIQSVEKEINELEQNVSSDENLLLKLKQSILQEAVQGKLVPQNPKDEPASELLKKIKKEKEKLIKEGKIKKGKGLPAIDEDEIPYELPKGWVWTRLGDVCRIFAGNSFKSKEFNKISGIKSIKITNVGVGEFIETEDYLPNNFLEKYSNFQINKGDIIVSLTRPYISNGLKVCICPQSYNQSLLNQRVATIKKTEKVNFGYLYLFLRTSQVLNKFKSRFGKTGLQPNLKMSDLTNLEFPLPPLSEQKRIIKKVDALMKSCEMLEGKIKQNKEYSEKLMGAVLKEVFSEGFEE